MSDARELLDLTQDQGYTTILYDQAIGPGTLSSLRLDEEPCQSIINATGFQPAGLHLTYHGGNSMLFSWQTGAPKVAPYDSPPKAYDPKSVESQVQLGTTSGVYDKNVSCQNDQCPATNSQFKSLVYEYLYLPYNGGIGYASPILHHVLVSDLEQGRKYFYRVGNPKDGWSREYSFTVPSSTAKTIRLGVIGDLGQTANSTNTLAGLLTKNTSFVLNVGDLTYADDHLANASYNDTSDNAVKALTPPAAWTSDQRRWDCWAKITEPLLATQPHLTVGGDHELENAPYNNNTQEMVAFNARYPQPQDPSKIVTVPNDFSLYLNASNMNQFVNSATTQSNNSYFSIAVPPIQIIGINSYLPYGPDSQQVAWFKEAIKNIDRKKTPWIVMTWHTGAYHTFNKHFRESDALFEVWEPLIKEAGVDVVMNGHVHGYERTSGVYNYTVDECAPVYLTIGDGGNVQGLYKEFVDINPQPYCEPGSPQAAQFPWYGTSDTGTKPVFGPAAFNGSYCPQSQPAYSRFRDPAFGYGVFEVFNETHAEWTWYRTMPGATDVVDKAMLVKKKGCDNQNKGVPADAVLAASSSASLCYCWNILVYFFVLFGVIFGI